AEGGAAEGHGGGGGGAGEPGGQGEVHGNPFPFSMTWGALFLPSPPLRGRGGTEPGRYSNITGAVRPRPTRGGPVPTRILLLRHAETTHPHVFNGFESDVGLSPRGEREARARAPVLAALGPDAVVSSGMRRALQTAAP